VRVLPVWQHRDGWREGRARLAALLAQRGVRLPC
jgi:hypothetical protein